MTGNKPRAISNEGARLKQTRADRRLRLSPQRIGMALPEMVRGKLIIGLAGLMASGKGTAAKYLEKKYQAGTYRFSTMLRQILDRLYLEHSRDNMVKLSEILRGTFGEDMMAKNMAKDVTNDPRQIIVVEGVRRLADITYLAKLPGFVLIEIFADPQARYERLIKRRENQDDATKTYEQFLADHQRSTELSILEVTAQATEKIDNNGNLENLHQQIDNLIKKYQKLNS